MSILLFPRGRGIPVLHLQVFFVQRHDAVGMDARGRIIRTAPGDDIRGAVAARWPARSNQPGSASGLYSCSRRSPACSGRWTKSRRQYSCTRSLAAVYTNLSFMFSPKELPPGAGKNFTGGAKSRPVAMICSCM